MCQHDVVLIQVQFVLHSTNTHTLHTQKEKSEKTRACALRLEALTSKKKKQEGGGGGLICNYPPIFWVANKLFQNVHTCNKYTAKKLTKIKHIQIKILNIILKNNYYTNV